MSSQMDKPYKTFKFEMGGMYMFYRGRNLGEALQQFIKDRPNYIDMLESITEQNGGCR
jgi:hypothetical protein